MLIEKTRSIILEKNDSEGLIDLKSLIEELEDVFADQPMGSVWINVTAMGTAVIKINSFSSK